MSQAIIHPPTACAIALKPANTKLGAQVYPGEWVKVQGRLGGLLRTYS